MSKRYTIETEDYGTYTVTAEAICKHHQVTPENFAHLSPRMQVSLAKEYLFSDEGLGFDRDYAESFTICSEQGV